MKDTTSFMYKSWSNQNWSLQDGVKYISENQEEKHKYSHDDFISVLFKELI